MITQDPKNSKIAERLKILSSRLTCVLNQLYHMSSHLLDKGIFKTVTTEQQYDAPLKLLMRRFPQIDYRSNTASFQPFSLIYDKVLDELSFHYNTLIDALIIKENLINLIGEISAFQYELNLILNYDMTLLFLDLITNYGCMLMLINDIPQIKQILSIYNLCMLIKFSQDDQYYPKLCERFVEKHNDNNCLSEFHKELNPFNKTIIQALLSIESIMKAKRINVKEWKEIDLFKIEQKSKCDNIYKMTRRDLIPTTKIHSWIIICCLGIYPELNHNQQLNDLFKKALENSYVLIIYRDYYKIIHSVLIKFFDSLKGNYTRIINLIKESLKDFRNNIIQHRYCRDYLRLKMRLFIKEFTQNPGLIGPNLMTICQLLSIGCDEINWLLKHQEKTPSKKVSICKINPDDFIDNHLYELIYDIEELSYLIKQYDIIKIYYRKILINNDLGRLKNYLEQIDSKLTEEQMVLYQNFYETIQLLPIDDNLVEQKKDDEKDGIKLFKSVRLDWLRLQTFLSYKSSQFGWNDHRDIVKFINTFIMHTIIYDDIDKLLNEFCTLKFLGNLKPAKLESLFEDNIKLVSQQRFIISIPRLCSHFVLLTDINCPEDYRYITNYADKAVVTFLKKICNTLCTNLFDFIRIIFELDQKLLPINSLQETLNKKGQQVQTNQENFIMPGKESILWDLTKSTCGVELQLRIIDNLASALNTRPFIVNQTMYHPSMYLQWELTNFVSTKLARLSNYQLERPKQQPIQARRRPTEMICLLKIMMNAISRLSNYVNINPSHVYTGIFLAQSFKHDSFEQDTISELYTIWYLDTILEHPNILYTPRFGTFVTLNPSVSKEHASQGIQVEEYTDILEIDALVQLLGPYGMKLLNDRLMMKISKKILILRGFVVRNKTALTAISSIRYSDYQKLRENLANLEDVDNFVSSWRQIGLYLAFKKLYQQGLAKVTQDSMPFIRDSVVNLQQDLDASQSDRLSSVSEHEDPLYNWLKNQIMVFDLCQAFGIPSKVDASLYTELEYIRRQQQKAQQQHMIGGATNEDFLMNQLLMVATGYLFPHLVGTGSTYLLMYEAVEGNAHCCAYAIKEMIFAFFAPYGDHIMEEELKRFVEIASSTLLRLGMSSESSVGTNVSLDSSLRLTRDELAFVQNRDTIYIIFDFLIQTFEIFPSKAYEDCFPYSLVRQAYHNVAKVQHQKVQHKSSNIKNKSDHKDDVDQSKVDPNVAN